MLSILCPWTVFGQGVHRTTFYAEAGGAGIYGSLNSEMRVKLGNTPIRFTPGIGFTYYPRQSATFAAFLPKAGFLYGKKSFLAGGGICTSLGYYAFEGSSSRWTSNDAWFTEWGAYVMPYLHLRYQPVSEKFFIGLSGYYMPRGFSAKKVFDDPDYLTSPFRNSGTLRIWPGISLGASLNVSPKPAYSDPVFCHAFYAELSSFESLNYEFSANFPGSKIRLSQSIGLGASFVSGPSYYPDQSIDMGILAKTTALFGTRKVQPGIGVVFFPPTGDDDLLLMPFIHVRYQPQKKGIYLALTGYPNLEYETRDRRPLMFSPGFDIGYTFSVSK